MEAKQQYIQQITSEFRFHPRKLYNHLHSLSSRTAKPDFFIANNVPVDNAQSIADAFNQFFHSTFTSPNTFSPPDISTLPTPNTQLGEIEISKSDVYTALCNLNVSKSLGPDQVHPMILKHCALPLQDAIHSLFVLCLKTGEMPVEWKTHKITPIPKKGNLLEISNYRPISLLCILSKVFESIVYSKIISFVRPKLSQHQFGFIKHKSCLMQLLSAFSTIHEAIDSSHQVDMIYLDFKKAFDSIPHNELLHKLWRIGITGTLWFWFRNYLSNRSHYVTYGQNTSSTLPVLSGVPQGSILGPLLFIIYVNDIPDIINHSDCYLFADDAKLLKVITSLEDADDLQDDLIAIEQWCKEWNLSLNPSKCSAMHFTTLRSQTYDHEYRINNYCIPFLQTQRDLGVLVSGSLSWSHHCDQACAKAYQSLHVIRRNVSSGSTVYLRKQLYLTLVKSHISYCCQLWRPHLLKDITSLERVQRRATKFILEDYSCDYKSRLLSLHLLPIMYWLDLQDLIFLIKCFRDPDNTMDIYNHVSFSKTSTRAGTSNKLRLRFARLDSTKYSYFFRVVRLWNSIPDGVINLSLSVESNKIHLSRFLWQHFLQHFDPKDPCSFHLLCPCHKCIL